MDTVENRRTLNINPSFVIGISILIVWIVIAIFAEQISPYNPIKTVAGSREAPSASFVFGTDRLGRDVLSRVMYGSRIFGVNIHNYNGHRGSTQLEAWWPQNQT